jgi:hypothetical protein
MGRTARTARPLEELGQELEMCFPCGNWGSLKLTNMDCMIRYPASLGGYGCILGVLLFESSKCSPSAENRNSWLICLLWRFNQSLSSAFTVDSCNRGSPCPDAPLYSQPTLLGNTGIFRSETAECHAVMALVSL